MPIFNLTLTWQLKPVIKFIFILKFKHNFKELTGFNSYFSGRLPPHPQPPSALAEGLASAANVSVTLLTLSLDSSVNATILHVIGNY